MKRFAEIMFGLSVFLVFVSDARPASPPSAQLSANEISAIDQAVKAEMEKQQLVGVAVGIIRDGEIAYLQGYGLADREKKTPVTTQTVMNWASNCKPMAAVVAMQLVSEGRLDLDADVRTYVPEFPDKGARITPRLILCHESGIVHYRNGRVTPIVQHYDSPEPYTDPVRALDKFGASPLLFPPGEKTSYSSYAYVLLSAVIQRAGQRAYDEQIMTRIARPLRLSSLQIDTAGNGDPQWANGYTRFLGPVVRSPEQAHYWKHGAGGFKSNIGDFARWVQALLQGRLLSPDLQTAMWTRQKFNSGALSNWGLGFALRETPAGLRVSHSGQQDEATSWMSLEPQRRSGIVILCNCGFGKPEAIARAVLNLRTQSRPATAASPD